MLPDPRARRGVRHRLTTVAVAAWLLRDELRWSPARSKINPIVRGWANYYRGAASSIVFAALDAHLWRLAYKWACHHHPHKPKPWIINRYFSRYNTARQDRWVFGDRASGAYLPKFAWTKIVRHGLVRGDASPDDPAQASYWAERRAKSKPLLDRRTLHLLRRQHGACPICGQTAPTRRPRATKPSRMGTVAPHNPQGDHRATPHRPRERPTGRNPTRSHSLPPPHQRHTAGASTFTHLKSPKRLA